MSQPEFVLVSSYTEKLGHVCSPSVPHDIGITVFRRVPPADGRDGFGELVVHSEVKVGATGTGPNPSYMCVNGPRDRAYVVSEQDEVGTITAFELKSDLKEFVQLGTPQDTGGAIACYVEVSPDGRQIGVANYGTNCAVHSLGQDGGLLARANAKASSPPSGVNAGRQEVSHPHMAKHIGNHILVPDLGTDEVRSYLVGTSSEGAPTLQEVGALPMPPGSGPRHVAVHPNGRFVYVLSELLSCVYPCIFDAATGLLSKLGEAVSTVPAGTPVGVDGKSFCACIKMSPDGRFVYASNRGHDSLAILRVAEDGNLAVTGCHHTGPEVSAPGSLYDATWPPKQCPRDFALAGPMGEWAIVANQDGDSIVILRRDIETGLLSSTGVSAKCRAPVCVVPV